VKTLGDYWVSIFSKVFGRRERKGEEAVEEYIEEEPIVEEEETLSLSSMVPEDVIIIKPFSLTSISDVDIAIEEVKKGNILLVNIDTLAERSVEDLKRAISHLRSRVETLGGKAASIKRSRYPPIIVTPPFVDIWRRGKKST